MSLCTLSHSTNIMNQKYITNSPLTYHHKPSSTAHYSTLDIPPDHQAEWDVPRLSITGEDLRTGPGKSLNSGSVLTECALPLHHHEVEK